MLPEWYATPNKTNRKKKLFSQFTSLFYVCTVEIGFSDNKTFTFYMGMRNFGRRLTLDALV